MVNIAVMFRDLSKVEDYNWEASFLYLTQRSVLVGRGGRATKSLGNIVYSKCPTRTFELYRHFLSRRKVRSINVFIIVPRLTLPSMDVRGSLLPVHMHSSTIESQSSRSRSYAVITSTDAFTPSIPSLANGDTRASRSTGL